MLLFDVAWYEWFIDKGYYQFIMHHSSFPISTSWSHLGIAMAVRKVKSEQVANCGEIVSFTRIKITDDWFIVAPWSTYSLSQENMHSEERRRKYSENLFYFFSASLLSLFRPSGAGWRWVVGQTIDTKSKVCPIFVQTIPDFVQQSEKYKVCPMLVQQCEAMSSFCQMSVLFP